MNIAFVSSHNNNYTGSYRIWVNDLAKYINELEGVGTTARKCGPQSNLCDADVVICAKGHEAHASQIKKKYPNKKVGIINLAADSRGLPIDFVIVGSLEEKDSLSHYDNVLMFPLIEDMFRDCIPKRHSNKGRLRIGFHGHYPHLSKFAPHLKSALESIDKERDIELLVVTSNNGFVWRHGRPNIKNIIVEPWDQDTIKGLLMTCDVGVAPNITTIPMDVNRFETSVDAGLYDTDYIFRMKNKSNAGRSFVFHQLGIPVIGDLTPSNFHIMGDPSCGFLVQSKLGWEKALNKLFDHELRNLISENARREFQRLYDPHDWAKRLIEEISRL